MPQKSNELLRLYKAPKNFTRQAYAVSVPELQLRVKVQGEHGPSSRSLSQSEFRRLQELPELFQKSQELGESPEEDVREPESAYDLKRKLLESIVYR